MLFNFKQIIKESETYELLHQALKNMQINITWVWYSLAKLFVPEIRFNNEMFFLHKLRYGSTRDASQS